MDNSPDPRVVGYAAPAWVLVLLAPLIAEALPGATRLSASFVFPLEVASWAAERC